MRRQAGWLPTMRTVLAVTLLLFVGCKKEATSVPPTALAAEPKVAPAVKADAVTGGSEPTLQVRIGGAGAQPTLPFEIVKLYEKQQPTEKPPFHANGGKWLFFDAKLADGTEFTVGLFDRLELKSEPPMTLVDATLSTGSSAAGEALALAYAKAFQSAVPKAGAAAKGPGVLKVSSVNLGDDVKRSEGGGFGGSGGGWTASKWTIERAEHAAEVFFNFNVAEKKGEWSQKDADYDADVARDFMEVLHDGAR